MNGDEELHDAVIIQQLLGRINSAVGYNFPGNEGHMNGILEDRVVVRGRPGPGLDVRYYDVVDRIRFDGQVEPWVRVGYYRELPNGDLNWGSQTAFTGPESEWEALFNEARRQKPWFKALLRRLCDAMHQEEGPRAD